MYLFWILENKIDLCSRFSLFYIKYEIELNQNIFVLIELSCILFILYYGSNYKYLQLLYHILIVLLTCWCYGEHEKKAPQKLT